MKYELSMKIEEDLLPRAHKGDKSKHLKTILALVAQDKKRAYSTKEIMQACGSTGGAVYGAIYRLAVTQQIEYYDKKYHVMPKSGRDRFAIRAIGALPALYMTRPQWRDAKRKEAALSPQIVPNTPTPIEHAPIPKTHPAPNHTRPLPHKGDTQQPLWVPVEGMSIDELNNLIQRAQKARLERMLQDRYDGADFVAKEQVCEVLRGYGIADPVALVHQKGEIAFLTLTATDDMPIVASFGDRDGAQTLQCTHITLHGAPLVLTLAEAYKSALQ